MMKTPYQNASVAAQIAALPTLKMPALWALWDTHFAQRPAHHNRDSNPALLHANG